MLNALGYLFLFKQNVLKIINVPFISDEPLTGKVILEDGTCAINFRGPFMHYL
jgi:hypothetical protein